MIFKALKQLVSPSGFTQEPYMAYSVLVSQSRKPEFYTLLCVEDSVDGRFDVIILHLFLIIHRLRKESEEAAGEFIRVLSEVFFADMDRSLREMGVGDTGVGVRIKKMAQAFYGRLQAYEQTIHDESAFRESLARNLYRGRDVNTDALEGMAAYAQRNVAHLQGQALADILGGNITFLS